MRFKAKILIYFLLGILMQMDLISSGNYGPLTLPNKDYEPLPPNVQKPNLQFNPYKAPIIDPPSFQGKI